MGTTVTDFHQVVSLVRDFFLQKKFIEVHPQSRLSILAACEDPSTIATFDYQGQKRPLPQTGQMRLEHELLSHPELEGCFCVTTSYRQEPHPVPGRHELIFPMFEFETHGGMDALIALETELIVHLGLADIAPITRLDYLQACNHFGTTSIEHAQETAIAQQFSEICLLTDFPLTTSPFRNMRREGGIAKKVDVLLRGMETIGSAERSCDPEEMRHEFHTISDGGYAKILYDTFGKDRVEHELEQFLSYEFFPRFGGGIGMTRLIRAMCLAGLLDDKAHTGLGIEKIDQHRKVQKN